MGINRVAEQARKGELPVVRVREGEPPPAGHRTKRDLLTLEGGWNAYLVRKFLKPDRIREVYEVGENLETKEKFDWRVSLAYEYSDEQIAQAETTAEWQKAKAKSDRKGR
jgi:hypothetical protein